MNFSRISHLEKTIWLFFLSFILSIVLKLSGLIDWTIPCLIKLFTGFECFSCGTTRAILLLLSGDMVGSWEKNPLGIIFLIIFASRIFVYLINNFNEQRKTIT